MRKILLILCVVMAYAFSSAQTTEGKLTYCMVETVPTNLVGLGSKCQIQVDFGQGSDMWKGGNDNYVVDGDGKVIKFNSTVDALNFMVDRGWEVLNEAVIVSNGQKTYHWLMKKYVPEGDDIRRGILQKGDF